LQRGGPLIKPAPKKRINCRQFSPITPWQRIATVSPIEMPAAATCTNVAKRGSKAESAFPAGYHSPPENPVSRLKAVDARARHKALKVCPVGLEALQGRPQSTVLSLNGLQA